jgi:hypothetical protein
MLGGGADRRVEHRGEPRRGDRVVRPGARLFYTQQHGDNVTYQIIGLD